MPSSTQTRLATAHRTDKEYDRKKTLDKLID